MMALFKNQGGCACYGCGKNGAPEDSNPSAKVAEVEGKAKPVKKIKLIDRATWINFRA